MNRASKTDKKLVVAASDRGLLSWEEFQKLAEVPPEVEWFANNGSTLGSPALTWMAEPRVLARRFRGRSPAQF